MQARTAVIPAAFAIALGFLSPSLAQDGSYPSRPVRLLVSSSPGGNPDILGQLLAARMRQAFVQAVVVESVQGAGTAMVALTEANATPDGYSLMLGESVIMAILPALNPNI